MVLTGRPHLVRISTLQPATSCQVRELNSGELRYNQVLTPRLKEVIVVVKGPFSVKSNAIENLVVSIDGYRYSVVGLAGAQTADFPDPETAPAPVPAVSAKGAPAKAGPAKTAPRSR